MERVLGSRLSVAVVIDWDVDKSNHPIQNSLSLVVDPRTRDNNIPEMSIRKADI
jgi:hypothetical protein